MRWEGSFPCSMIDQLILNTTLIFFLHSSYLQPPLMHFYSGRVKKNYCGKSNFCIVALNDKSIALWLQKIQITTRNFELMFKMLKIYSLKIKLNFFPQWDLHGLFGDEFAQFNFKFELIWSILAHNHFACTFNVLQSFQSLLTIILWDLKGWKNPSFLL